MTPDRGNDLATVREVVADLARLERGAGSPGEHEAAVRLAAWLERVGVPARIEEVEYLHGYARLLLPLGLAGVGSGVLALDRRRRVPAAALSLLAVAALVDDVSNGRRIWRRLVGRRARTTNVIADTGPPDADHTLVVMAHHDAAPTGVVFDQGFQRALAERFPDLVARIDTSLPLWWPVAAGPLLVALGALSGSHRAVRWGTGLAVAATALAADVARDRIVPGANDNLSAVAALVVIARRIAAMPPGDGRVRVVLVSLGAEEVLQGGVHAFAERHFPQLARERTSFLNLDSVGSPELVLVEGEGPFRMEDYCVPRFRDLVAEAASSLGRPLRRGVRARASTDAVLPSRAGYPTATLASWDPATKLISNYHLMTDTPERLCGETVVRAADVTCAVAGMLAAGDPREGGGSAGGAGDGSDVARRGAGVAVAGDSADHHHGAFDRAEEPG